MIIKRKGNRPALEKDVRSLIWYFIFLPPGSRIDQFFLLATFTLLFEIPSHGIPASRTFVVIIKELTTIRTDLVGIQVHLSFFYRAEAIRTVVGCLHAK